MKGNIYTRGVPSFNTFLGLAGGDCKGCRALTCGEEEEEEEKEEDHITSSGLARGEMLFSGGWRISRRASIWHAVIGWERGEGERGEE